MPWGTAKRGALGEGKVPGQKREGPRAGTWTVVNRDCFCRVLVHLTTIVAKSGLGMKSALWERGGGGGNQIREADEGKESSEE